MRFLPILLSFALFSSVVSANTFTQYPSGTDTDGAYTLVWANPAGTNVLNWWVNETKSGSNVQQVASSGTSVSITGRGDGVYVYDLWVRSRIWDSRIGEYRFNSTKTDSVSVTVSVTVNPPNKPSTPAINNSGSYTTSWNSISGAVRYTLQEAKDNGSWTAIQDTSSTSKSFSGKSAGNYSYRVRACTNSNCSNWSATATTKVVYAPSSAPAFTSSANQTTFEEKVDLKISWSSVSTASEYELYENVSGTWTKRFDDSQTTTTFSDRSLGSYPFRVRACNQGGCGPWSSTVSYIVSQKANISGPTQARGSFTLSWLQPGNYTNVSQNGALIESEYLGPSLTLSRSDGTYTYRAQRCMHGIDGGPGNCSQYGLPFLVEVRNPPGTPGAISNPQTDNNGTFSVSWGAAAGAVHKYELYRQLNSGNWSSVYSGTSTSASLSGLADGTYAFRVRACNTFFSDERCSSHRTSSATVVANAPSTPSSISGIPTTDDNGAFTVSWATVPGNPDYYELYQQQNNGNWSVVYSGTASTKSISSLVDGTYTYRVRACNSESTYTACGGYRTSANVIVANAPGVPPSINGIPSSSSNGAFTISWSAATGDVDKYELYQLLSGGNWVQIYSGSASSHSVNGLANGIYSFRVRACNSQSNYTSCGGYQTSGTSIVAITPSIPPSIVVPSTHGNPAISISWGASTGSITKYDLDQQQNGGSWSNAYDGTAIATTVSNLTAGSYLFRVRACVTVSSVNNCSGWRTSTASVLDKPASAPNLNLPDNYVSGDITVTWSAISTADNYRLDRKLGDGNWSEIYNGSGRQFSSSGGNYGDYYYRVRGCNSFGCGAYSLTEKLAVLPASITSVADTWLVEPYVPSSDLVGEIPGSLQISGGAASYSIPIDVPPGRHGLQPDVSLTYNSQSGEGLAGYGWSLTANSSISRCANNFAIDGSIRDVQLNSGDRLCLDGQRLILVQGSYGAADSEYYTEKYSRQRIRLVNGIQSSSAYFIVTDNNNRKKYYGNSNDSRITPSGASVPLRWHLKKVSDSFNNSIIYDYNNTAGEFTLAAIWYTGTGDTKGTRQVKFEYMNSERSHIGYIAGASFRTGKILDRINIIIDGAETDYYQLDYQDLPKKLQKISHCTAAGCLYSDFDWYDSNFDWTKTSEISWHPYFDDNPWSVGDLELTIDGSRDYDGDGIFDLLYNRKVFLSRSTGKRFPESADDWTDLPDNLYETHYNRFANTFNGHLDANGDGRTDALYVDRNGRLSIGIWDIQLERFNKINTNISVGCVVPTRWDVRLPPPKCTSYVQDFNGDGITDLLLAKDDQTIYQAKYRFYKGCIIGTSGCSTGFIDQAVEMVLWKGLYSPIDVDGDGLLDLAAVKGDYLTWYKTTVNNGNVSFQQRSVAHGVPGPRVAEGRDVQFWIDANRDGLQDILTLGSTDNVHFYWYYLFNKGNGQFSAPVNTGEPEFVRYLDTDGGQHPTPAGLAFNQFVMQFDYDNDGVDDILVPRRIKARAYCLDQTRLPCGLDSGAEVYNSAYDVFDWKVVLIKENNGQISFESIDLTGFQAQGKNIFIADVNGDGLQDISAFLGMERYWYNGVYDGSGSETEWHAAHKRFANYEYRGGLTPGMHTWVRDYNNNNLLREITTHNGRVTAAEIKYKPLSFEHDDGTKIYEPTDDSVQFPYIKFTNTMKVVSEIDRDNGVGGMNTTRYYFEKALFHKQGRGFQGFGTITEKNLARGVEVENQFYQAFPYSGEVSKRYVREISSGRAVSKYEVVDLESNIGLPSGVVFPHVARSRVTNYDLGSGAQISTVTTTNVLDSKANLMEQQVLTDDATTTHLSVIERDFTSTSSCANLLTLETKSADVSYKAYFGAQGATEESVWSQVETTAWDRCQPVTQIQTASDSDPTKPVSDATATHSYQYNGFGNVEIATVSGGSGLSAIDTRTTTTTYDSEGYFAHIVKNNQWNNVAYSIEEKEKRFGNTTSTTDPNGLTTTYTYNEFGQLDQVSFPSTADGSTPDRYAVRQWCDSGCPANALLELTDIQAGTPTTTKYLDSLGRAIQSETEGFDGTRIVASTVYNSAGDIIREELPHFEGASAASNSFSGYDVLGRPGTKITDSAPSHYTATYSYSGLDTDVSISSADGSFQVSRTYNALKQLIVTEDADGNRGYFRYDGFGNPTAIVDVNGNTITAGYDGLGNKQWFNDPNMGLWRFIHNGIGELKRQTDANASVTVFTYDKLGRLTQQVTGQEISVWDYDEPGHYGALISESRSNGFARDYYYDTLQRVKNVSTSIDGYTFDIWTGYDRNYNRVKAELYPSDETMVYRYNTKGYLAQNVRANDGTILRQIEDLSAQGEIASQTFGNGLIQHFVRSTSGAVDSVCTMTSLQPYCNNSGAQNIDYDYDTFGNLTLQNNLKTGLRYDYGYDSLHRLDSTTLTYQGSVQSITGYGYDNAGNFTHKGDYASNYRYGSSARNVGGNAGPNAVRQVTKLNNSVVNFTYDNNGNMLSGDGRTIAYNSANKPIEIVKGSIVTTFDYGSDEQRFKQVIRQGSETTTVYYVGKLFEKRVKRTGSTVTSDLVKTYFGDFAVATRAVRGDLDAPSLVYLSVDRLGSVATITDGNLHINDGFTANDLIVQQRSYGPFGQVRDINAAPGLPGFFATTRAFTGHEQLPEVELIHMNGRAYDYKLGRFLSVDPFVQFPENTQSANPYSYVLNNPLSGTDPSGYTNQCSINDPVSCLTGGLNEIYDENGRFLLLMDVTNNGKKGDSEKNGNEDDAGKSDNLNQGGIVAVLGDNTAEKMRSELKGAFWWENLKQGVGGWYRGKLEEKHAELVASCIAQTISGSCNGTSITPEMADTFSELTGGTIGAIFPGQVIPFASEQIAIRVSTSVAKNLGSFADETKLISHFVKHGGEFGARSSQEYLAIARHVMNNGIKINYMYKDQMRTGFVQFMRTNQKGVSKFAFVGTNSDGYITTLHVKSGKDFWKTLNGNAQDKTINMVQ